MAGTHQYVEVTPGFVAESILSVATNDKNSLEGIDVSGLQDRASCWVRENDSLYLYLDGSSLAPSLPNVVAPAVGPGRWILIGGPVVPGGFLPLSRTLFMDGTFLGVTGLAPGAGNGSIARPYGTIQEALNYIATQPVIDTYWEIVAIVGNVAEALVIPPHRNINITLSGNADLVGLASVTWNDTHNPLNPIGKLSIGGGTVFGDVTLTDAGDPAVLSWLLLGGTIVTGKIDASAHVAAAVGNFMGLGGGGESAQDIIAPTYSLVADGTVMLGNVTIRDFDRVYNCALGDSANARTWTVSVAGANYGFIECEIQGPGAGTFTLTGPAGCGRMDYITNYFWLRGAGIGAFGGAATKVLIEDETP